MRKLVLHQFSGVPGLASVSPYCLKVHYALHLKGLAYETNDVVFAKKVSPTGRLPALAIDDQLVEDSTEILRALEALAPAPSLYPAEAKARALAHVLEDWADESLYFFVLHVRWARAENYARVRGVFMADAPPPLRLFAPSAARRGILKKLRRQGLGGRSVAEIDRELERHVDALDALVAGGGFVAGEAIGAADLAIVAQLQMLRVGYSPEWEERLAKHAPTTAWIERVLARVA